MKLLSRIIEPRHSIPKERQLFSNRDLLQLVIPIITEQFLVVLVGIADTVMISYAGEAAVSGVALIDQVNMMFSMIFTALASGGAVVVSQYLGSRDAEKSGLAFGQLLMISTLIGLVTTTAILLFGRVLFSLLFGQVEAEVMTAGLLYLRISAWSYIFLAVYNACAGLFRSVGNTKPIMYVSIGMNTINVVGNAIGIFALHAGVAGVAYPSLISRIFAAAAMLTLTLRSREPITLRRRQVFCWNGGMLRRIFRIAVPGMVENGLFQLARVALTSILALFGTVQIAAYGVAQSFWSMAALFCIAMGPGFITVVGRYMGAADTEGADYYMSKLLRMTYVGAIVWAGAFLALTPLLLRLYNVSAECTHLVLIMVIIHNVFDCILCPTGFALSNGLRAAGDVRFTLYTSLFATVLCRTLFTVLLGKVLGMGVIGLTWAMIIDWFFKALLTWLRRRSGKWKLYKVI